MTISCLYRPPMGKHKNCQDFLKSIYRNNKRELWLLGDFNVDYLDRTSADRLKYIRIFQATGLKQYITKFTRPNKQGGTCLDWIVTNSLYVKDTGTYDLLISDHLPAYCIRKKARENHQTVYRSVCDLSNFDADNFSTLVRNSNWDELRDMENPDDMWLLLYKTMYDILSVMCPFKRYKQRARPTRWLNADIYKMMRWRDNYIRLFRATRYDHYLTWACMCCNRVTSMISKAKANYIRGQLRLNERNPKKFWRIIQNIIAPKNDLLSGQRFFDQGSNGLVKVGDEPDFLNRFFVDIVKNLEIPTSENLCENVYNVQDRFCFTDDMPTEKEIVKLIGDIDVNKSSCVKDINTRFCKLAMLSIPKIMCLMFSKSLSTGLIPSSWVEGTITLIPKDGDLTRPGNWRPITQTSIFAKL